MAGTCQEGRTLGNRDRQKRAESMAKTIDLYEAVREMRRITAAGGTFSMKFRKWNRSTSNGGDLVHIKNARLRPKTGDRKIANASYKLFFRDDETGRDLNCWECLLVEFNGKKTILI